MKRWGWIVLMVGLSTTGARAETQVATYKPQYLPPAELTRILGLREREGRELIEWRAGNQMRSVEVLRNDPANLIMLTGEASDVAMAEVLVKAADVAPRQIMVEAQVVEVNRTKVQELGFDWSRINVDVFYRREDSRGSFGPSFRSTREYLSSQAIWSNNLRLLQESGAATFRDAPRLLTLNNRRATILDGQRVTYITRYSSFTNLFETDTLDAGLTVSVLPSLGESGYLTLDIRTELTSLSSNISGSPVKDGQIVENTVMVKNGESVLLGGFQRTSDQKVTRRFPVLGHVLPFLFSRETVNRSTIESFVVLTARVVDLTAGLDERTRQVIEGR